MGRQFMWRAVGVTGADRLEEGHPVLKGWEQPTDHTLHWARGTGAPLTQPGLEAACPHLGSGGGGRGLLSMA